MTPQPSQGPNTSHTHTHTLTHTQATWCRTKANMQQDDLDSVQSGTSLGRNHFPLQSLCFSICKVEIIIVKNK